MLENLHIRNLALVSELNVEFGENLNIVTGETGAGKSLVIGAVQLLTGARADTSSIRKGEKSCEVAGIFRIPKSRFPELAEKIEHALQEDSIPPCEEERLLLRRVITENGSRAYVNGSPVPAAFLRELMAEIVDIHGPHDNQTLLSPHRQLLLLDTFAGLASEVKQAKALYDELRAIQKEREELRADGLTPEELNLLEYQLQEITDAHLQPEEEEELVRRFKLAANAQTLAETAESARQLLCGEDDSSIAEQLASQLRNLRQLEELDPDNGAPLVHELETAVETLRDLGEQFGQYAEHFDLDQKEMQTLESRLNTIQQLKRKYGPTLTDVLETADRLEQRIRKIQNRSGRLEELQQQQEETQAKFLSVCNSISKKRATTAPRLAAAIQEKLRNLGFLNAQFSIALHDAQPGPSGKDSVAFRFAPNVGEDAKDLKEIASSGEIARVMLAIKTVLSDADHVPVLIFDEIDANVGGQIACAVAEELLSVAKRHQVFSITHLPQIAAAGNMHYLVSKSVVNERTETAISPLGQEGRISEIVRMLGADANSNPARQHAQNLLNQYEPTLL